MDDTGSKNFVSRVEVASLLNAEESRMQSVIDGVDNGNDEQILIHSRNLSDEFSKIHDISKEHHEHFSRQLDEQMSLCRLIFMIFKSCWNLKLNFFLKFH